MMAPLWNGSLQVTKIHNNTILNVFREVVETEDIFLKNNAVITF